MDHCGEIINETTYIGGGLYAKDVGGIIRLETVHKTDSQYIYLEPEVFEALLQFAIKIGQLRKGRIIR